MYIRGNMNYLDNANGIVEAFADQYRNFFSMNSSNGEPFDFENELNRLIVRTKYFQQYLKELRKTTMKNVIEAKNEVSLQTNEEQPEDTVQEEQLEQPAQD